MQLTIGVIVICAVFVFFSLVSLLVIVSNSKLPLNRLFLVVALVATLWTTSSIISFVGDSPSVIRVTSNAAAALSFLIVLVCFLFSEMFRYGTFRPWVKYGLLPLAVPLTILFSTNYNCGTIDSAHNCSGSSSYNFMIFLILALFGLVIRNCIGIRGPDQEKKAPQARILLWGLGGGIVFGVLFGYALPALHVVAFNNYYSLAPLIFVTSAFYAIIRHSLFDIRTFVLRGAAYVLSVVLITIFYLVPAIWVVSHIANIHMTFGQRAAFIGVSLVVIAVYGYVRRGFDRLTRRVFYRDYYDSQDVLDRLSDLLVRTIDTAQVQAGSKKILLSAIRATGLDYWIEDDDMVAQLKPFFRHSHGIVVIDELTSAAAQKMRERDIAVIVQLRTTHGELGYMTLGFKESGQPYSSQDKRLLVTVADEIAISMQNALHFEEIQNFNRTLQGRVQQATKELRKTNEKLKALDETKDEFITMASHQLRTPLTSVKGYLSMVLEGDAGRLNAQQQQLLTQSFISSQRMVYLIADLLNLSRLNTGKFVIESIPVDLREVVQGEIDQLRETAKSRGLTLVYDPPATFPRLMLDETKIHQVVMNFIDNAIYYTQSGGTITIQLLETKTAVEYRVVDNGIGVPKAEQHRLFTKFYRAGNARRARPDGTGLGLFMAKKVIVAQGGAIIFESEEGKGSTFGFRFTKAHHVAAPGVVKTEVHEARVAN
jgi:signal transduction histidine kinase